jgi:hypothetical protein
MLQNISIYDCKVCEAILSKQSAVQILGGKQKAECPFCHEKKMFSTPYPITFRKIFDDLNNNPRGGTVDALFVECNGVTNPRLVLRFRDDYFHELLDTGWNDLAYPIGFEIVRTRSPVTMKEFCPVELIYYFDIDVVNDKDEFSNAVNEVCSVLADWIKNLPR